MKAEEIGRGAKVASNTAAHLTTEKKNEVLEKLGSLLGERREFLFAENLKDLEKARSEKMADSLIERLKINGKIVDEMIAGLRDVRQLADPVGEIVKTWK